MKSVLIHECRHKSTRIKTSPTRVNTNQHQSDTSQLESKRINTSQTWVTTNQHESDTSQLDQETIIVYGSFSW